MVFALYLVVRPWQAASPASSCPELGRGGSAVSEPEWSRRAVLASLAASSIAMEFLRSAVAATAADAPHDDGRRGSDLGVPDATDGERVRTIG
jgi:hypothetical protein